MPKVRCVVCREYVERDQVVYGNGVSRICSQDCLQEHLRARGKAQKRTRAKQARKVATGAGLRQEVRKRDGNRCRWCGVSSEDLQVHHVRYRSEGGPDVGHNLVTLCSRHHAEVHASKRRWQPVLLALLWKTYVDGVLLTVPEVERLISGAGRPSTGVRAPGRPRSGR